MQTPNNNLGQNPDFLIAMGVVLYLEDKGGKFLKKILCCISERVKQGILALSIELIM